MANGKRATVIAATILAVVVFLLCLFFSVRAGFPRPYRTIVLGSGIDQPLAYAVMKAESNFSEGAVSRAGAIGVMQILPSTAEFICRKEGIEFVPAELYRGEFNVKIGCLYLNYLLSRFRDEETALAAYNAGEGKVSEWLRNSKYSKDGISLSHIPYRETEEYIKKVKKFRKFYNFFY